MSSEWLTENVLALIIGSAVFGGLSVAFGLMAGFAGHREAVIANDAAAQANKAAEEAKERTAEVQMEAAITEERLLTERRITARERWQMETIINAVMPRRLVISPTLVAALKGLGPINVAIVDRQEPRFFGGQIVQLFHQAGIMGQIIWLPDENDHHGTTPFLGVTMYTASERGSKVAEILWQQEHIGGGTFGVTPMGWEAIPKTEDTLIVGINDTVWQPQSGQPGEGVDGYGGPVPAPQ